MSQDNSVIIALEAALSANPNDVNLLLHLANVLVENKYWEKALTHFQQVLAQQPTNSVALQGAYQSALELNQSEVASGYKQLLDSLSAGGTVDSQQNQNVSAIKNNNENTKIEKQKLTNTNVDRVRGAGLRLVSEEDDAESFADVEDSNVYLKDVGGMEAVKRRIHLAFLGPLQNPELMKAYGKSVKGGLLLYGPPGCGKTFIARAMAGELGAKFITVGLNDILDMYVGESESKLHKIFEASRRNAPAVLFIDELDAIGQKRSQLRNSGMRSLVNQLLSEMDSIGNENNNVFVLAATNHPWDVDTALRRPGRFDRVIAVFPPDYEARVSILNYHLKNKPADTIDVTSLAEHTEMFSGADLAHLCESAVEFALEESLETGQVRHLKIEDFQRAIQEIRPSTLTWFETARNYAMFANESGSYDDLLAFIRDNNL